MLMSPNLKKMKQSQINLMQFEQYISKLQTNQLNSLALNIKNFIMYHQAFLNTSPSNCQCHSCLEHKIDLQILKEQQYLISRKF